MDVQEAQRSRREQNLAHGIEIGLRKGVRVQHRHLTRLSFGRREERILSTFSLAQHVARSWIDRQRSFDVDDCGRHLVSPGFRRGRNKLRLHRL